MTPWERATTALALLQIDPDGLGGLLLHARSGPVRDAFTAHLPPETQRLHPALSQDTLTGGIDVSSSLAEGALVQQKGLLDTEGQLHVLTMAERIGALMAGCLATCLDAHQGNWIIALDEHTDDEPPPPVTLTDRLAFHVSLEGTGLQETSAPSNMAIKRPRAVSASPEVIEDIVALAVSLGITSLRAPTLTFNAAKAHAALNQRNSVTPDDVMIAAELVLAPRATQLPQPPEPAPEPQPETEANQKPQQPSDGLLPEDILLAAIATALPADLLSKTGTDTGKNTAGSGAGQKRIGNRTGRPLPARNSNTRIGQARVDLMATLRAAIPWQKMRKQGLSNRTGPVFHPSDLRYKRYEDLSDRLLIFAVDASGSAALARLAEAKGAVELLLAEAYARRDHVALISFRGDAAELILPPTRSLVQTKRRLADLPGGGGTPLASGLKCSLETADTAQRKGLSPVIILLTDGRSNVALDGSADRTQAAADALQWGTLIARAGIDVITIDTGKRPERTLKDLSTSLRGQYISLPRADARAVSETVTAALGA